MGRTGSERSWPLGGQGAFRESLGTYSLRRGGLVQAPAWMEITLAILQLQGEIIAGDPEALVVGGGRCPKEEDHRAKGQRSLLRLPFLGGSSLAPLLPSPAREGPTPISLPPPIGWAWRTSKYFCFNIMPHSLPFGQSWSSYGPRGGQQSQKR